MKNSQNKIPRITKYAKLGNVAGNRTILDEILMCFQATHIDMFPFFI